MAEKLRLTREQLAAFLGRDHEAIKQFERLFAIGDAIAPDVVNEVSLAASIAQASANEALDRLREADDSNGANVAAIEAALSAIGMQSAMALAIAEAALLQPNRELDNSQSFDYIDIRPDAPVTSKPGRLAWDSFNDTLNIYHTGGVTQQVGHETYARVRNKTGATLTNGTVVGFDSANQVDEFLSVKKYIADGTMPSLFVVGILTQDIVNNGDGRCTVWGAIHDLDTTGTPVGETWASGDVLYPSTTTAGKLTKIKPTAANVSIPIAVVLTVSSTVGVIGVRPTIEQQKYYGTFNKTTNQSPAAINTAYAITFDSASLNNGVSIGSPTSRIVVASSGLYEFSPSYQLTSGSSSAKNVWFWFRKNGTDIANTSFKTTLTTNSETKSLSRSMFFSLAANDYIELMFAADDTNVTLDAQAATAFAPAGPACILTVTQIQQ